MLVVVVPAAPLLCTPSTVLDRCGCWLYDDDDGDVCGLDVIGASLASLSLCRCRESPPPTDAARLGTCVDVGRMEPWKYCCCRDPAAEWGGAPLKLCNESRASAPGKSVDVTANSCCCFRSCAVTLPPRVTPTGAVVAPRAAGVDAVVVGTCIVDAIRLEMNGEAPLQEQ